MPTRTSVFWKVTAHLFVAFLLCSTLLASAKQKPLTNDDIIKMTKAGLDEDVIVGTMQSNANAFDLSPDGLISLKKGGVSSKVLHTMQSLAKADKDSGPAPVPPASPAVKAGSNKKDKGTRSNDSLSNWKGPMMRLAVMDLTGSALKMQTATQPSVSTTTIANAADRRLMSFLGRLGRMEGDARGSASRQVSHHPGLATADTPRAREDSHTRVRAPVEGGGGRPQSAAPPRWIIDSGTEASD